MARIAEDVATNLVQRLIDGAIREVNNLCCFKTHAGIFEKKRDLLVAKKGGVLKDIEDAKKRNETQVEEEVECWLKEANGIIDEDTKTKMKFFHGWYPNCIGEYKQGRKLAKKVPDITDLIERCNFDKVARPAQPLGIKYYSPQNFIDFDSRKSKLKKLVDILQDGSYYMIGLNGLGGTGKTTLATKVGEQVEESRAFQKVIFAVVSNPPDILKIREKIASQLQLRLDEKKEEEQSLFLWARIANYEGKVLIILDDVWEWLNLKDIGIPSGPCHKNCSVLITTRDSKVCEDMRCQQRITLDTLNDEDASKLFVEQVGMRSDYSSMEFEDIARGIAKECGGIPLAIVAVASALQGWSLQDLKFALKSLQDSKPLSNVDNELKNVYGSLKLSYDRLQPKAQFVLLLCSLFPEDYEIPMDLLSKLAVRLGPFREAGDSYYEARRKVTLVKYDVINSFLLLEARRYCVKMHDLVREVVLWIADGNVQAMMDTSSGLRSNLRFLFWSNDEFPECFNGTDLEILIISIKRERKVRDTRLFEGMDNLKVLSLEHLPSYYEERLPLSLSLLISLKNIQTLILHGWRLGNISILKNLECLETLELEECSIIELPKEVSELQELKLLALRSCNIEMNNPFEVIERCSQLDELYYVLNHCDQWKPAENMNEVAQDICSPMLQRYSIICSLDTMSAPVIGRHFGDCYGFARYDVDDVVPKCFNTKHARELISKSMFKYLIGRAEVLEFCETGEATWESLVDGAMMKDLIKLHLFDSAEIQCLIDSNKMSEGSFKKLQILTVRNCVKLRHLCFDGYLNLAHLKSLCLENCPMLQPFVAPCVDQLEELIIRDCKELTSLISYESLEEEEEEELVAVDQQKRGYGSLFPKLKSLVIEGCDKMKLVSPLFSAGDLPLLEELDISHCEEMKYMFGKYKNEGQAMHQHTIRPSITKIELERLPKLIDIFEECQMCILKDDSKEKHALSFFGCCFLPTTKDIDIGVSCPSLQTLEAAKESSALKEGIETFHTTKCLIRKPFSFQNIRKMTLYNCSKLKSLFSVSIATTVMLEELEIKFCSGLKHIIASEGKNCDPLINHNIFPKLKKLQILCCKQLEFLFPSSTFPGGLQKLQSMDIEEADALKYVFGANNNHQNINAVIPIDLPALKHLSLKELPEIISLCANKYYVAWPSIQRITLSKCGGLVIRTLPDFMASHQGRHQKLKTKKELMKIIKDMQNLSSLEVGHSETIENIFNVEGIQSEVPVSLSLQEMELKYLSELRHIFKDPNNILKLLNLKVLKIEGCDKLRALFTSSTLKNLPQLYFLEVMNCKELVHIIEEDDAQEVLIENVFPNLSELKLKDLPELRTICRGIKINSVTYLEVVGCPKYEGPENIDPENESPKEDSENESPAKDTENESSTEDSENESPTEELQATHSAMLDMGETKLEQKIETQELVTSDSPKLTENFKEAMTDIIEEVPISKSATELEGGHVMRESIVQLRQCPLGETKAANTPSDHDDDSIDVMLTKHHQEGPILEDLRSVGERLSEDSAIMQTSMVATSNYSQARGPESGISALTYKETGKGVGKVVLASKLQATILPDFQLINKQQPRTEENLADQLNYKEATSEIEVCHQTIIAITKEAVEQSFQEHDGTKEAITPTNSNEGFYHSLERGKEVPGIATASTSTAVSSNLKSSETGKEGAGMLLTSGLSMATTSSNLESTMESVPEDNNTLKEKTSPPPIYSQAGGLQSDPPAQVTSSFKGTLEQGPQQNYATVEDKAANKSIDLDSEKHLILVDLLEIEKAQSPNEASKDISEKVSASGAASDSILFDSEFTKKETTNIRVLAEKAIKANLSTHSQNCSPNPTKDFRVLADVIPPLHHQPQIGVAASSPPTLEIGEIFQLVEMKGGEPALLANALKRYPQLRLPRERRTNRIIALSYRVLVDILAMLTSKTPCTITASDRSILEDNLGEAAILGFDNKWIESVRTKISGSDMLDVLAAEKEMIDMEAKLKTCEIALDNVHKQRSEAKERLEAIDSQLFGLLENRKKLVLRMAEIRDLMGSKDKPFGF